MYVGVWPYYTPIWCIVKWGVYCPPVSVDSTIGLCEMATGQRRFFLLSPCSVWLILVWVVLVLIVCIGVWEGSLKIDTPESLTSV